MTQEIGVMTDLRKQQNTQEVGAAKEPEVWERDDAPPGSTSESLLVFEGGRAVRVAGPTHYHHLADGRIVGGFSGGTHHDDGEKITRIVANHEG